MKIIILASLVFFTNAHILDPYSSFPLIVNDLGNAVELHQCTNNNMCIVYNNNTSHQCTVTLLDSTSKEIARIQSAPYSFTNILNGPHQISWGSSTFVIPLIHANDFYGILKRYNYTDFSLDASFGNNGTTTFTINNHPIVFTTVLKKDNYYYVGGFIHTDNYHPLLVRFDDNGNLDTTFNITNTPGYTVVDTIGSIAQMLFLEDTIILKLYVPNVFSFSLASISNQDFSLVADPIALDPVHSNIAPYNNSSFFICSSNTIQKYTDRLVLDTTFNNTGSITFLDAVSLFSQSDNYFPLLTLTILPPYLLAAGNYSNDHNNTFLPYIICYNIRDIHNPYLEGTFFKKGYLLPEWPLNASWGAQQLIIASGNFPSLFISGDKYVKHIALEESFVIPALLHLIKEDVTNITDKILLEKLFSRNIPFLSL